MSQLSISIFRQEMSPAPKNVLTESGVELHSFLEKVPTGIFRDLALDFSERAAME